MKRPQMFLLPSGLDEMPEPRTPSNLSPVTTAAGWSERASYKEKRLLDSQGARVVIILNLHTIYNYVTATTKRLRGWWSLFKLAITN